MMIRVFPKLEFQFTIYKIKAVRCRIKIKFNSFSIVDPNTFWTHCASHDTPWYICTHFTGVLCAARVFQLFETLKAAPISHHAPLHCLWIHSVGIVMYVQCFSVVHCRQSLLDLFYEWGWWCVQGQGFLLLIFITNCHTFCMGFLTDQDNPHTSDTVSPVRLFLFRWGGEPDQQKQWQFHHNIYCKSSSLILCIILYRFVVHLSL